MKQLFRLFLLSLVVVVLTACSDKDIAKSKINLLSPKDGKVIDYNYVTLEVEDSNLSNAKAKVGNSEYLGIKNNNSFFIYNVPLKKGKNQITLVVNSGEENKTIEIISNNKGVPPVRLDITRREGYDNLNTSVNVETKLNVSKYLIDKDSDGIIDDDKTTSSFNLEYNKEGRYFPVVTVKTSDGVLYTTHKNIFVDVKEKPKEIKIASITEQINDLERFGGYIWALSSTKIYKIDENNQSNIETIVLPGVNNPEGFCYDNKANLYIADSGNNRVLKLLANSHYQPDTFISADGSFGTQGSGKGEFENPVDCMVDSAKDNEKIFVIDKGNNRIEIFNKAGVYTSEFDGSNTAHGKLNNPEGILASSALPIISDTGNGMVRSFDSSGNEIDFSKKGLLTMPKKISRGKYGYIVADSSNNRLVLISYNLNTIQLELPLSKSPVAIVSFTNSDDNYYVVYSGIVSINKISANSDVKGTKPIDITKAFVDALLKKDRGTMESLSSNSKVVDGIFEDIDAWIKFLKDNDIKGYNTYSNDGLIAGVEILFNNTTDRFFVNLIKYKDTWYIKSF